MTDLQERAPMPDYVMRTCVLVCRVNYCKLHALSESLEIIAILKHTVPIPDTYVGMGSTDEEGRVAARGQ